MFDVADIRGRIDELAQLMDEFHLAEARLESDDFAVAFRRRPAARPAPNPSASGVEFEEIEYLPAAPAVPEEPVQKGSPVASPMAGIYYTAANPGSPPFVKEGDEVSAGQIIGLIEAMKVFNEIPSPLSGVVLKVVAEGGSIVQPGDTLVLIEPWP